MSRIVRGQGIVLNVSNPRDIFDAMNSQQDRVMDKMPNQIDGHNAFDYTPKAPSLLRYGSRKYHNVLWQCLKREYLQSDANELVDHYYFDTSSKDSCKDGLKAYKTIEDNFNRPVAWWRKHATDNYLNKEFKKYTQGEPGMYTHADVGHYGPLLRRIKIGSPLYKKIAPFGVIRKVNKPMTFHDWFTLKFNLAGAYRSGKFIYFLGTQQKFIDEAC